MGKLIAVVGNLGVGKTTLTKLICDRASFIPYWEIPEEHPFQMDFTEDLPRWALTNQIDFLLYRYEQEFLVRQNKETAVMDGGLDQDFHVFTKNLYNKGHLLKREFDLCERFYRLARRLLPPPDVIVKISVDPSILLQRRLSRERKTVDNLFDAKVFIDLEVLLDQWLSSERSSPILQFVFEQDLLNCAKEIDQLTNLISNRLLASGDHDS